MWEQFNHLGRYESNVIDTTNLSIEETVLIIKKIMKDPNLLNYICPKDVAAEWLIPKLPKEFLPLVELAIKGYRGEYADEWNELEDETVIFMN